MNNETQVLAVLGDINGDGFNDVVLGEPDSDLSRVVRFPQRELAVGDTVLEKDLGDVSLAVEWPSEPINDDFTYSEINIVQAGDINGDGFDEIGVKASYYLGTFNNFERFYVIFGRELTQATSFDIDNFTEDEGFLAESTQAQYSSLDYGGFADIDGDGFDDLLLGRPYTGRYYAGSLKILFGDSEQSGFEASIIQNDYDDTFTADREEGKTSIYFGAAPRSIGDINQDGLGDFAEGSLRFLGGPPSQFNDTVVGLFQKGLAGYEGFNSLDNLFVGDQANDRVRGREGDDNLYGLAGDDTLIGNEGNDRLIGDRGSDRLKGRKGDDVLVGGFGNDSLVGGAGRDRLIGGAGLDSLRGGSGADQFVFRRQRIEPDRIFDFTAEDVVKLKQSGFDLDVSVGQLAKSRFVIGNAAQDKSDRIIYNPLTGDLLYDADGSRAGQAKTIAILDKNLSISANQIQIF